MTKTQGRDPNPVAGAQSRSPWVARDAEAGAVGTGQGRAHPRAGSEEGAEGEMIPGDGKDKKGAEQGYLRRVLDDT